MKRKTIEQQIQEEVRSVAQKIETNRKLSGKCQRGATAYAEEQLRGVQTRFENGAKTVFGVLERQANYLSAKWVESRRALISYKKSLIAIKKYQNAHWLRSDYFYI